MSKTTKALDKSLTDILACPICGHPVRFNEEGAGCGGCAERYFLTDNGQLNLKPGKPRTYQVSFTLGEDLLPGSGFHFNVLPFKENPDVDFSGIKVPSHLTRELLSYFPKATESGSIMLDLGCGTTVHREVCQHAGFNYVGADYDSDHAEVLLDAHCLPFRDNSFEFILSIAVLEHIRYPFVMMQEVFRVLKPGGRFIGTVSFLEPFHSNSYYHHTHLGTYNTLKSAGFNIRHVSPNPHWTVLKAQAGMSLFPKMPSALSRMIVSPLDFLHRIWWKLAGIVSRSEKANDQTRLLKTTGAFFFVAEK